MRSLVRISALALVAGTLAVATHSYAQNFAGAQWIPLTRNGIPIGDAAGDATGTAERDIVGDAGSPAAYVFQDNDYLYFRLRLNASPVKNGELEQLGWGCVVEANNGLTAYEFASVVNGIEPNGPGGEADAVEWVWNQTTSMADDVAENADVVVSQHTRSVHSRVISAPTSFGGNPDFFLEWAVPLATVRSGGNGAPGIAAGTTLRFACGSSNNARNLAADPVCSQPNAQCTLSNSWSDPIECGATSCGKDTDNDGVMDHVETALGTNPASADSDGDGIPDAVELTPAGGGPFFPVDTDGDGTIDALDTDDDNDGIATALERADTTQAGLSDDVDGDGKKNWLDDDADGDGIKDGVEGRGDVDGNGKPDYLEKPAIDGGVDASVPDASVDAAIDAAPAEAGVIDGEGHEPNPGGPDDGVLEGGGLACNASATGPRFAAFAAAFGAALAAFVLRRRRR